MSKTIKLEVLAVVSDDGKQCDEECDYLFEDNMHHHLFGSIQGWMCVRGVVNERLDAVPRGAIRCPTCLAAEKEVLK